MKKFIVPVILAMTLLTSVIYFVGGKTEENNVVKKYWNII